MNTVAKGNAFEKLCYNIMTNAIADGKMGVDPSYSRIFTKKGYYSEKRKSEIFFDISIEVWPPNANRAIITYFIECKDYNHKIPVDDVTLFNGYIQEVAGVNAKGVFIARGGFQSGAYNTAESYGMMLISVEHENYYDILLYSKTKGLIIDKKSSTYSECEEDAFFHSLQTLFIKYRIERTIKRLSKSDIGAIAEQELLSYRDDFFDGIHSLDFTKLKKHIEEKYQINVHESAFNLRDGVWGLFNPKRKEIVINSKMPRERRSFVLAHEFGHAVLHLDTIISQEEYKNFEDSQYNFKTSRYTLNNPKNWIEWQANYFAASLLMHKKQIEQVQYFHQMRAYGRYSHLYIDDQYVNIKSFNETVKKMAYLLGVSVTSLTFRLNEFSMIKNNSRLKSLRQILDDYASDFFV